MYFDCRKRAGLRFVLEACDMENRLFFVQLTAWRCVVYCSVGGAQSFESGFCGW